MTGTTAYVASLAAGILVGVVYGLIGVHSPAPPLIALCGLFGILIGEQVVPIVRRLLRGEDVASFLRVGCARHILGHLPKNEPDRDA
ncbi:XapX domain-containing protein [Acuticoccus sediminis]|uniref:XapX domain-containing protein n=1 Tax=Acuticoccus sediminis TaxID=2184697 RepID=A0A8B2P0Z9_9HYPH|nr:XapX domain-containing protein [Acuticoccus sediminis]RAI01947.1 XapX domain-containing protein [Acuticoccus sediminis]